MEKLSIEEIATFCKKKGFVIPTAEIYGSFSGFYDYSFLGVEMKNNIKQLWWKFFVQQRDDIIGIDGSIITNPKVWHASGHARDFIDYIVECSCSFKERADHFLEEKLNIKTEGLTKKDFEELLKKNNIKCPKCNKQLKNVKEFNLMFKTFVGPIAEENTAFLRPETAQLIFADFKSIISVARIKLPFGIAQIGKAFRNEISPRNFLFRLREFEQMEIEYFVNPEKIDECPYLNEILDFDIQVLSRDMQEKNEKEKVMKIKDLIEKGIIKLGWHAYWLATCCRFLTSIGIKKENLRLRQHLKNELAHYATDCWDIEYRYPFGWKELLGIADRGSFDLSQHQKYSKQDLTIFDQETNKKVLPVVIAEPSFGIDRLFLTLIFEAYYYDKERGHVVLKLNPRIAPIKAAVFPLLSNKKELVDKARNIYNELKKEFNVIFDVSGSIGRRYARADEIGIPFCITIDFQTLQDDSVTVRDRDTTKQERIKVNELKDFLRKVFI